MITLLISYSFISGEYLLIAVASSNIEGRGGGCQEASSRVIAETTNVKTLVCLERKTRDQIPIEYKEKDKQLST